MNYQHPQNIRNAERGRTIIESHPDFGKMTDDPEDELQTAATDTIADILHALNAADALGPAPELRVRDILERAHRAYLGDFEDEPQPPRSYIYRGIE